MIDLKDYLESRRELTQFMNEILEPYYKYQKEVQKNYETAMDAYEGQRKLTLRWMKWFRRAFIIQSIAIGCLSLVVIIQAVL